MTIEEFIQARLTEDEAIARAALRDSPIMMVRTGELEPRTIVVDRGEWVADGTAVDSYAATRFDTGRTELADHAAAHDPARVLRQVEAIRRVIADYEKTRVVVLKQDAWLKETHPRDLTTEDRIRVAQESVAFTTYSRILTTLAGIYTEPTEEAGQR
jgi:hypothetical protein